jgi:hypothetical protein
MCPGSRDVGRPFGVILNRVDRKADHLDAALVEFRLEPGDRAQFGGADRREILGVREENGPVVADPLMKLNDPLCGLGREIGSNIVDSTYTCRLKRKRSLTTAYGLACAAVKRDSA